MPLNESVYRRKQIEEEERRRRERAVEIARGGSNNSATSPQTNGTSNSTNSSTSSRNSSYGSQTGSQTTPAERDLFKITGRRHTVTDRRRGIDKNEKTQRTGNISGQNRGLSRDDNDRFTNTIKGAGKQWLGGQLSGIGTTAQADIVNINSIRGARAERENDYRLTSREEADKREAESVNKSRTKDGVNLRDMERRYSLEPEGNVSDNYGKIVRGTQKIINKGDSLIESGTQDIEKAKEGATDFEKFLIDNGAQFTQWAGDASLRLIPVVGQVLSMGGFFNRAGGMSAYQGRQEGMNPDQQFKYYAGSGLMEVLSELTFQSVGALRATYGKGMFSIADKLTTKASTSGIVNRLLNNTELGKSLFINMARLGGNAVEEGLEEVETDLVDPLLKYFIKKSEDPRADFEGWDLKQMGYDFLMGATMGGVLGVAEVPNRVKYELNIANSDAFNDGMTTSLIKQASVQGRQSDGGRLIPTNAELLAQQLQQQMDNNIPVQPAQIRMLQEAIGQSISENQKQLTRKMTQEYDKAQKSGDLVQMEGTRLESQGIDNASVKLVDDAVEKARQVIGENATQEDAEAVAGVTTGVASTNEIDTVLAKPELKKAVETIVNEGADAESAVSIPVNNAEARDVLENLTAVKRIANRNTILKDVQAKNAEIIKSSVDNMSEGGKNLFASRAEFAQNTIGGNRDRNLEIYRDRFSRLYTDGNTKGADFETSYKRIIGSLDSEALKSVFTEDFARQIFEEGRNAIITNNAKETAKSKAEEYANRKGGLTFENNNENLISARVKEVLQKFAERVGVEIHIVKSLSKDASGKALMSRTGKKLVVNGKYQDGVIYIASDAQNKLITVAKHELTHHLKETSPEMYQKLEDFVFERWYHGNAEEMEDEIARYTKLYSGQGLDRDGIREEIIADASEAFFTDEGAIQDAISFSEKLGRAIHDGIKTMLDAFLGLQDADSRRMRGYGGFLKDLGILQEAERMWLEALEDTQQRKKNARGSNSVLGRNDSVPTEAQIRGGDATYGGLPIKYDSKLTADASNFTSEVRVSDKFFDHPEETQRHILNHEVAHNLSDRLMGEHTGDWNDFASKFIKEKKTPESSTAYKNGQRTYWEGLYGDIGATALSETVTRAITEYLDDPQRLRSRSTEAYDEINSFMTKATAETESEAKNSLSESDQAYMDAVNRGDMETAQRMVDEEAKKHGYDIKAYHGTNAQFTRFDPDKLGSKNFMAGSAYLGFFASASKETAESYTGLNSMDAMATVFSSQSKDYMEKIKRKYNYDERQAELDNQREQFFENYRRENRYYEEVEDPIKELKQQFEQNRQIFVRKDGSDYFDNFMKDFEDNHRTSLVYDWNKKHLNDMYRAWEETQAYKDNQELEQEIYKEWEKYEIKRRGYVPHVLDLYLKMERPFVHDFKGEGRDTESFASRMAQAKEEGYDGCIFKNVADGADLDDIYTVFSNTQLKSADPVTYDDNGNVIPLSQRFNESNEDIRYSVTEDSDGNKLSEGQREYFGNSKIVDSKGNLKVMYHGSPNDFDTFDIKRAKAGLYGRGFYFTEDKSRASQYGKTYGVYLDVETPLQTGTHDITRSQLKNFIKVLAEDEDYGIENYGYGATVDSVLKSIWGKDDFAMLQDLNATAVGDFAEAVKLFNKVNGTSYDGIVAPTETIAFYPEQIKETSNKKPTKNPNMKFSVTEPVEETKDLLAVHNLKAEDLRGALDLGGFPMPSIAIIKADAGHNAYGEYSAVFDKSTIDPSVTKKNVVYGGDAWTPTFPQIQYKPNEKVVKRISDIYYDNAKKYGYDVMRPLYGLVAETETALNNEGGEAELKKTAKRNTNLMRAFLTMNGKTVDDVIKRTEETLSDDAVEIREYFINHLGEDVIRDFEGKNLSDSAERLEHRREWSKNHRDEVKEVYADYLRDTFNFDEGEIENVIKNTNTLELTSFVRDALNYLNNGKTTIKEEVDYQATKEAVKKEAVKNGFNEWVDDLLDGIEEKKGIRNNKEFFTYSGNRRSWETLHDEVSLVNIVKAMASQDNGETFLGSSLKAVAQKQYKNISEIRKDKGRLKTISEDEYKALMDGFAEREKEILLRIAEASPTRETNYFMKFSDIRSAVVDDVRKGLSKEAFLNDLKKWGDTKGATMKDVEDILELVNDVANSPTGYFEAKPKRPVTFYEVKALLAPSDAPTDLISRLQDEGVNIVQYEAGNDEDRIAKLNQASEENNLKFSVSDDEVLDRYIVDRQKRIDDGEQMSFFGSLNETIPSKPKEKTRSEKFYDNVLKTISNIKKKGSWSGFEVKGLFLQYPEFNFIERLNNKADETAVSDFNAFLSSFDKIDDLRNYNWFFSAYEYSSQWKKANRSGKMKFNKLIENRIEEIMAGKAHGRNVGIEKRDYTPTEMRKLFNELNTDKELEELGKKVFDCIDKNFDVKFQGVANIEGFKHGQGGTLGQAGGRTVHLNMKYLNSEGYTDQQKASTILHESIHTVTVYALRNRNNYTMPKNIQDACDVIEDVFWQIKNDPMFKGEYGVSKGAEEMVAELANPTFRAKLKAKNVFARIIEAIRNILGINVEVGSKANAFKEVNSALETLMSNADVVSFERYANRVSKDYNGKFSVSEEDENAPTPKEYQSTIAKLEEKVADLKSEFKRTDLKTADPKQTRIQAGRLLKRHDSNLTLQGDVVDAFSKIHRLYKEKGIDAFEEASQIALDTAKQVVSGIAIIHDEGAEQQKEIREFLKDNEIIISPYIEKNMDDFASFRKKNAFRLKLKKGEVSNLDKYIYPRLQELFPTAFPDEYYKANNKEGGENTDVLVDMLRHIGDVLDNPMYEIETIDELTPEWKEYVSDIASDIMETAYGLQTKKTFADKKYEEKVRAVAKAREEALASRDRALAKQAERYETKISYLKQRNKDFKEETRERAEKNRRIAQIAGIHKRLLEKLDNPKDTKHLPAGYAPLVSNVLSMFDFTTKGMEKWAERYGEPSKRYRYLDELRKRLADMSKEDSPIAESGFEIDPDIIEIIEELKADVADTDRLSDLDSATLEDIYTLFKAFEHQLNTFNKAFDENNRQTVSENRDNFISETRDKKTRKDKQGTIGWLQRQLETNNTTPEDFFHLIGGTPEKLYKSIRKGFDKHIMNVKSAMDFIKATTEGKDVKKWSENVREYTTSFNETIKLTDAQLMSIYCLSKREQAQQHMYSENGGSGIVVVPQKVGKGLKAETLDRANVVVNSSDIQKWISQLSKEQIEVADRLQRYLSEDMSKLGNETSLKLYGYKKFTEKNYFPIQSSNDWLNSNFDFKGDSPVLKNTGMTKALNKHASNPIVIDDIFTVATKHISTMSLYNSLVPSLTDFQRFWNSKDKDHNTTVQKEFIRVYGEPAYKYVENFMGDLNGAYKRGFEVEGVDKLMSKYKQASIGLNLRVLFQQPTAVARAGAVMNPIYITEALGASVKTLKDNLKDMREHCPIALWKSWGFYNTDLARDMRSIMMDEKTLSDNFSKAYGIADDLTWSVIFKAVRYEVEAQNKNLEVGSDEYWEKVNERASEVFDRTQVVDSPFHRSQNMRAKDNLSKMVTAFMAEPTKTYNMLKTELTLAKREIQSGQKAQGVKRASRVVQVFVTNAILVSASSAVIDALRGVGGSGDDDKDKNWFERFLAHWWTNTKENINPLGLLPVFKDVQSVVQGYDVTRMDMQAIGRMVKSLQYMGEYIKEPENSKYTFKNEAHYLLQQSAYLVGLPLANLERDTRGVALSIAEAVGYDDLFFEEAKFKYQVNDKTKSMWADMYLDAKYKGNTALAKKIKDYITSNGAITDEYIDEREKKYKKDNKSASQQHAYDSSIQTLEASPIWTTSSEDNKEYYTGVLENISVGIENQSTEYVTKLAKNGLTNEQVILYKLALKKVDKPNKNGKLGGTPTNAEKEDAIRLLERYYNLTQAQKDTLMGK